MLPNKSREELKKLEAAETKILFAPAMATMTSMMKIDSALAAEATTNQRVAYQIGMEQTFIGGGCCVHLSIEYMPTAKKGEPSGVVVVTRDSEGTVLIWAKPIDEANMDYQIKEDIITTHPGAELIVITVNATARVRWCEIFSC